MKGPGLPLRFPWLVMDIREPIREGSAQDVLLPHELAWLQKQQHMPVAASQALTDAVRRLSVPEFERVTIDSDISQFHSNLAACERLYGQPIPIAYTRHTSRQSPSQTLGSGVYIHH
jgi:predicted membrane chloride channel (bestrophin family)